MVLAKSSTLVLAIMMGTSQGFHVVSNKRHLSEGNGRIARNIPQPRAQDLTDSLTHPQTRLFQVRGNDDDDPSAISRSLPRPVAFSALMTFCGTVLGPFLDSYHSAFGVLQYDSPITATLWGDDMHPALITTWWVPYLFGLAGFVIGWLYILLDAQLHTSQNQPTAASPTTPRILVGIAIFTFQYWLSGVLVLYGVDRSIILSVISLVAAIGFAVLDRTLAGLIVSTATAVGGPLIEVGLLSLSRLHLLGGSGYHYTDLGETGYFPLWILPVYFLGGPAVGNLARGFWKLLSVDKAIVFSATTPTQKKPPGCMVCNDTRRVACPNCDGIGTYEAMARRSVACKACRGSGFVICRACFSYFDEDPNDLESIRRIMSRIPD